MATLYFTPPPPSFSVTNHHRTPTTKPSSSIHLRPKSLHPTTTTTIVNSFKVVIEHDGESTELEVDPDETILSRALDAGVEVPYDCKLGVCMTCPAKLVSGKVDQSEGMLSDDVVERGYALLCAAYPRSDCVFKTIPEDELLAMQLATAND